jgi:2-polyprenyl-3-methyl-5-hydroxy-6-metoxy-1,4-benzoquinol methylase
VGSAVGTTYPLNEMRIGDASLLRPPRTDSPEMLDLGQGTLTDVRENLHEMWRINRWLGGLHALNTFVLPRLHDQAVILDIGTGGAEIPIHLIKWAEKSGAHLQVIGLDWAARNLLIASENTAQQSSITLMRANALELPLAASSVDIVLSSLFLHHFPPDDVIRLLRSAYQCARRSIVMTDLVRGWLPLLAFKLITPLFARNRLTRYDGALSIRRAYTPSELYALACEAGLPHARLYRHWPWRMTLVADKP